MRKTSQNIILYFICILGGLILSVISRNIYLQNQQKLLDNKEDTQYKQYLEEYVKSNGTVDRIFFRKSTYPDRATLGRIYSTCRFEFWL